MKENLGKDRSLYPGVKVKQSCTGLDRPCGFQEVEAPRFRDSRHMKVVRSAVHTGQLLHDRRYPWYSFMLEATCSRKVFVDEKFR